MRLNTSEEDGKRSVDTVRCLKKNLADFYIRTWREALQTEKVKLSIAPLKQSQSYKVKKIAVGA